MNRAEQIEQQAKQFHQQHEEVWYLFCQFTHELVRRGFRHYSAKGVFERIRWETATPGYNGYSFKLNNNYSCCYARWFMEKYPEYDGFFRTRARISELAPACGRGELTPRDYA